MRITAVHVDGYGVLSDLGIEDLPPGLTVVHGANEAGKTTLLDFVRGMLFGFPDRRRSEPYHEPLRGGRHGGSLAVLDDRQRRFVLERHLGEPEVLRAEDGSAVDRSELARILGGANDQLFRNVFAFGLSELNDLATMQRDEIRDVLFSAGILGAGRSATLATRQLDAQRDKLVRARQQSAVANALRARLDEVESRLRVARRAALGYPERLRERERFAEEVRLRREEAEALRRRLRELDALVLLWPTHDARVRAEEGLSRLGEPDRFELAAIEHEADIAWLVEGRTGHLERLSAQQVRERDLENATAELETITRRLGSDDVDSAGLEARDRIDRLAARAPLAMAALRAAEDSVRRRSERVAAATALVQSAPARAEHATTASLEEQQGAARRLIAAKRQLDDELARAERARDATQTDRRTRPSGGPRGTTGDVVLVLLAALGAAVAAAAAFSVAGRDGRTLDLLGGAAGLVAVLALVVALRLARSRRAAATVEEPPESAALVAARQAFVAAQTALGLSAEEPVDPDGLLATLERALDQSRSLDHLEADLQRARSELEADEAAREAAEEEVRSIDEAAATEARALGFAGGLSVDGLVAALADLTQLAAVRERIGRIERALAREQPVIDRFHQALVEAERAVGTDEGEADLTRRIRALEAALAAARSRSLERGALREQAEAATAAIVAGLGGGEDGRRLAAELSTGALGRWSEERAALAAAGVEADAALDAAIGSLRDADRDLAALLSSSEIVSLETEADAVRADLDAALEQWLVLGAARSLLDRSLARYEQERQPKVIEHAGALFCEVTDGRYVSLLAHEDGDGRRRGIAALTPDGRRVESELLSRGTKEQLYLCLRLAFADTFAEQAVALPLVLDDVLVNFDPKRAAAVARAFATVASSHQVLAFTCHPHVVELFAAAAPGMRTVELG